MALNSCYIFQNGTTTSTIMKKSCLLLTFLMLIGTQTIIVQAQTLDEKLNKANVIYVAPLVDFDYYALQIFKTTSRGSYSHDTKYEIGDYVDHATDPEISFEIVGRLSEERLAEINELMINQLRKNYGDDKVKMWPDEMKNNRTGDWDQKNIDCEYYVVFKRIESTSPVLVNYVDAFSTDKDVKPKIAGGSDMFTINLYEKVKSGKKGKVIIEAKSEIFKGVEPVIIKNDFKEAANQVVYMTNENLSKVIETTLEDFFASIKGQLIL